MEHETQKTILVVDDTPENLRLLAGALSSQGYRVLAFPSGELALRALKNELPDLILLDINMPGMNGFEVCDAIKSDESLNEVPVLFISALQETEAKLKAFEHGGLDYITKPFRLEEVFARVKTHIELHHLRIALESQNALLTQAVDEQKRLSEQLMRESRGRIESQQSALEHMGRIDGLTELSDLCAKHDTEMGLLEAYAMVARRVTGAEFVELLLVDATGMQFRSIHLHLKDGVEQSVWSGAESMPWALEALESGTRVINASEGEKGAWASHYHELGFHSVMALPVLAGTTPIGMLTAASRLHDHFDKPTQNIVRRFASTIGADLGLHRALKRLESNLDRADAVLISVLPQAVTRRLKRGDSDIADRVSLAGVFFCDLAGFTAYSSTTEPEAVVAMLQETFALLEQACRQHKVEKIKTIGDAFMAVSGVSVPVDDPIKAIADFAMDAADTLRTHLADLKLGFRIGIHAGPVLAGVIGTDRLFFDIWGDTVNFASRLESSGSHGEVRCSDIIRDGLGDNWRFGDCGVIELKGKGAQQVWSVLGCDK